MTLSAAAQIVVRGESGKAGTHATSRRKTAEISKLAAQADRCAIAPSSQKATCLIFASLIHSTNPVWVALLRDGNPIPFSATLPL